MHLDTISGRGVGTGNSGCRRFGRVGASAASRRRVRPASPRRRNLWPANRGGTSAANGRRADLQLLVLRSTDCDVPSTAPGVHTGILDNDVLPAGDFASPACSRHHDVLLHARILPVLIAADRHDRLSFGRAGFQGSMWQLTHDAIDFHSLTETVRRDDCGAVVLFLGTVRSLTHGRETIALDYEAFGTMAEKKLAQIEAEVRDRWPIGEIAMVHRLGHLRVGDVSVAVALSAPHRAQAFEACRYAIDRLKEIVPIWKKENWSDGSTEWVHPGAEA